MQANMKVLRAPRTRLGMWKIEFPMKLREKKDGLSMEDLLWEESCTHLWHFMEFEHSFWARSTPFALLCSPCLPNP